MKFFFSSFSLLFGYYDFHYFQRNCRKQIHFMRNNLKKLIESYILKNSINCWKGRFMEMFLRNGDNKVLDYQKIYLKKSNKKYLKLIFDTIFLHHASALQFSILNKNFLIFKNIFFQLLKYS